MADPADPSRIAARTSGLVAPAAVVVMVIVLAGAACAMEPGQSGARLNATPTSTLGGYPAPHGQWVTVSGMSGGIPAIASSDPRVVYEVFNAGPSASGAPALKRSTDGGTTWQVLRIPGGQVQPGGGMGTNVSAMPSPSDPNLVFLTIGIPYPRGSCPTWPTQYQARTGGYLYSGYVQCSYEYRSTDGGQTWKQITLPVGGQLFVANQVRPVSTFEMLYAQGARLYSIDEGDHGEQRLVRSDDGGVTWRVLDDPLVASGRMFFDYMPTRDGSIVFAVTTDTNQDAFLLWRSDDAGNSWRQVGALSTSQYAGMQVVDALGSANPLLYIAETVRSATSPTGFTARFWVSEDGGISWTPTPTAGLPPADKVEPSLLGTLADGSVLVEGPPPSPSGPSDLIFYAWKLGQLSWRQVAPDVVADRLLTITMPDASGHQAIWVIQGYGDGTVQRIVLG